MAERRDDEGVFDATTGKWMARVAANPQAGQYVFDKEHGYTFAAADEGHARRFVGDPVPLTAEEIAELRTDSDDHYWTEGDIADVRKALPRLLDEVERLRDLCGRAADELRGDRINGTWDEMVAQLEAAAGRKP